MRFWRHGTPQDDYAGAVSPDAESFRSGEDVAVGSAEAAPAAAAAENPERHRWSDRLKAGMARSSARLTQGINTIFNRRRLDDEALLELEELLIASDMGVGVAGEVTEALRKSRFNQEVS